jgi:DNA-binding XRE family transcriptional regulator
MHEPQIIRSPAGEELVVIPRGEYEALVAAATEAEEMAHDVAAYDAAKAAAGRPLPPELSMAIIRGERRLRAIRKWRNVTQEKLAEAAGITQGYLSDLEGGRRTASADCVERLASALDVPQDWLS